MPDGDLPSADPHPVGANSRNGSGNPRTRGLVPHDMPIHSFLALVAALPAVCAAPLQAQHDDRIWGRVFTDDGDVHEGFIHVLATGSSGSWADVLPGSKEIPEEYYQDWLDAARGGKRHTRVLELKGYRVSWVEKHPSFTAASRSGMRFGHLAELTFDDGGKSSAVTRSQHAAARPGDSLTHDTRGRVHIGPYWNRARVWIDEGGSFAEVRGRDIRRIEFGTAPGGRAPASPRLYGTVEDRSGRSFTGFVTWDGSRVLESHVLDGYWEDVPGLANPWESGSHERSFRFSDIRSLERTPCFARVTLKSDSVMELCNEPLEPDPKPVRISDPALGLVEVEWYAVRILSFEPSPGTPGRDAFDGGRPLSGTVVTREGEETTGRIRWDADEEWSWELLQGTSDGVEFSIEFGNIKLIEKMESRGARVTLTDGRSFRLEGGNDIGEDNRGIFIFPTPADDTAGGQLVAEWRYVAWEDLREARFDPADNEGSGS